MSIVVLPIYTYMLFKLSFNEVMFLARMRYYLGGRGVYNGGMGYCLDVFMCFLGFYERFNALFPGVKHVDVV